MVIGRGREEGNNTAVRLYESPIGPLFLKEQNGAITEIEYVREPPAAECGGSSPLLEQAVRELDEYFRGKRREFDIPVGPKGTAFQQRVWEQLRRIPYGETRTYGQIAAMAGSPKGARAAGMACNRNPILIVIPCHRVIGADGSLTGFGAGLPMKKMLLALEAGQEREVRQPE